LGIEQRPNNNKVFSSKELQFKQQNKNAKIGFKKDLFIMSDERQFILVRLILFWTISVYQNFVKVEFPVGLTENVNQYLSFFLTIE
jgi:hypothetical protein